MNNADQDYESNILKLAINKYLDQKLTGSQKELERIELNKDELVWDVVSTIYNQSGYKVSMSFAKDVIDQRIKDIKNKIKQAEEKAHLEMMKKIKAEAEEKARLEMIRIKAEQKKIEKQTKIIEFLKNLPSELKFDETKLDVFMRVHKVCCEHYHYYQNENGKLDDEQLLNNQIFMKIIETEIFTTTLYEGGISNFTKVSWYKPELSHTYKQVWHTCNGYSGEALSLFCGLEEEFELEIEDSETEIFETFKDIVELIYSKIVN